MSLRTSVPLALATAGGLLFTGTPSLGQALLIDVGPYNFSVQADSFGSAAQSFGINIGVSGTQEVPFKYVGPLSRPGTPDFVVVIPASGVAPGANVGIGLNPNVVAYLPPGGYAIAVQFATPGESPPYANALVQLSVMPPPPPVITSVVNAASLQPAISPGELVSIFGANLGTPPLTAKYDDTGLYPTTLGNTTVTFNGTLAPLLYVSTGQINAVVPFEVAGQKTVNVVVTHDSQASPSFSLAITDTSPAMFTVTQTGKGQGAILNAGPGALSPGSPNSVDNPAPQGSAISIFATGGGSFNPPFQDGVIILGASGPPAAPVSATIGGQPAKILYAGAAPYEAPGVLQVNAMVPQGIGSGAQPVVLAIGNYNNASQQVTVVVK